ncbi:MAG TPA: IS5 family transposase [Noviherbaspirillum sp.]|nr:IS5 family transposase [Noviherbaspirillum sp.]HJV87624.1 IS5 family transposase [Noviherbaspirillum sp.]
MARQLVDDELWEIVQSLLPVQQRRTTHPGRKRLDERRVLTGILFVLQSGLPWDMLPQEMGCGSGMTCWRRASDWQKAGVWEKLHHILLAKLRNADRLDFSRVIADSSSVRAVHGGKKAGPNPTDRRKAGSKHHLVVDANGTPLNVILTGANPHDSTQLTPLLDGVPAIAGRRGRPLRKPRCVQADRAYDCERYRLILQQRGIHPQLAKRCTGHGSHLGVTRWVVERTFAWLHRFRRLRVRYERRADMHEGFLRLGCAVICWRTLRKAWHDPFPFPF